MTYLQSNMIVSRSVGTITFHENTMTYTIIHYTTWEFSYHAIPTLALTFADFPVVVVTRTETIIDVYTVVPPTRNTLTASTPTLVSGIIIGAVSAALVIAVMIWFVVFFSRRNPSAIDVPTATSELSERNYCLVQIARERVQNPIFCGIDDDSGTDPFCDDFSEVL
jgi:uncharacterized protein (DUF2062 family)